MTTQPLTVASLFCGAGGLDLGFEQAGFETVWANDFNADACETMKSWSSAEVVHGDIGKVAVDDIPDTDVILGGFPCQGFSLSGPRRLDDSRNSLYKHYVSIVKAKQPLAFVGENVKGLLTMGGGEIFEAIVDEFSECGYTVHHALLNARDYSVAQDRQRVILVGFRKDLEIDDFAFPAAHATGVNLRQAIGNMAAPDDSEVCWSAYSPRFMSRNRKRGWDEVSFTIPAMAKQVPLWPGSPDMVKLGKDSWQFGAGVTRRLSWREAAVIQSFPDDMVFHGNLDSVYRQIGNAVPPNLGRAVAEQVARAVCLIPEAQKKGVDHGGTVHHLHRC